jgi:hypothetical protein
LQIEATQDRSRVYGLLQSRSPQGVPRAAMAPQEVGIGHMDGDQSPPWQQCGVPPSIGARFNQGA